jgi:hypothetical protein
MKADEIDVTLDGILALARELVLKKGINSVLIDPYNYIESKIPAGKSETLYISDLMSKLVKFAKMYNVHVHMVAHPTKIQKDKKTGKYVVPNLYDIAGSANFYNKTFNGICIYRDYEEKIVTAHVQKVKFKWIGHVGSCDFNYDYKTGRYAHPNTSFEDELELYLAKEAQTEIIFEDRQETQEREQGQLTDINFPPIINSFDFQVNAGDPPF